MDSERKRGLVFLSIGIALLCLVALVALRRRAVQETIEEPVAGAPERPSEAVLPSPVKPRPQSTLRPIATRSHPGRRQVRAGPVAAPPPSAPAPPSPAAPSRVRGRVYHGSRRPVAAAVVTLRGAAAGLPAGDPLAEATTGWDGSFSFDEVQALEEAWIEVKALYYLPFKSLHFTVRPGVDLDLVNVTLQFGGSIHGELRDGTGRGVSGAEVVLVPRNPAHASAAASCRTDSKGTFVLSGLQTGEYQIEVWNGAADSAFLGRVWAQADGPTLSIEIHLHESLLTLPQEQDFQQFRVYRSEKILSDKGRRFHSIREIQKYVDRMIASGWWGMEHPEVHAIEVRPGKEEDLARGGADEVPLEKGGPGEGGVSGHIELPRWAWNELTVLHEVAHVISHTSHGSLFAGKLYLLVSRMIGDPVASDLARAYAAEGVQW